MASKNTSESASQKQQDENHKVELERLTSLEGGRKIANPLPGEEIVISGMSAKFPEANDILQYKYNLVNKVDMITSDNRRWDLLHPEIPQRSGKINNVEKFDAGFFGVENQSAHTMDPMCRQLTEKAFEAAIDAGVNPYELRGTNTGVFIGLCFVETDRYWFFRNLDSKAVTGCSRSMLAQRISYIMGLQGPAYIVDTACSSSLYAFEHAYRAIRTGRCDSAFVGGATLCVNPMVSLQLSRLGVLSLDGCCKSFDEDANGYVRSEAVSVIYLQKSKDAKRIYAQVLHSKANCDGYKELGITYPAGAMQKQLFDEIYQECNIDPGTVDFLEAHATGTKVGDPEEILAMDEVFCTNRKYPLYVGSIKSNLGHSEGSSGMCSLVKVLISMEGDCLLPNLHFTRAREGAEALEKGRMIVVTEKTPWPENQSNIAAINSFGFGGANAHVVLKRVTKTKINEGRPKDDLTRLITLSGRTEEAVTHWLNDIVSRPLDAEYVRLLHDIFRHSVPGHFHKGYLLFSKQGELTRSLGVNEDADYPLVLALGAPNENIFKYGAQLLEIPLFAASIQKIFDILKKHGINIMEIINEVAPQNQSSIILGSIAIQIAIVDILKSLELSIDNVVGFSLGQLVAAYADGTLSLEETVNASYFIVECLAALDKANIVSYCVELRTNSTLPPHSNDIEVARSYDKYCIVEGHIHKVESFVNVLKNNDHLNSVHKNYSLHTKFADQIHSKLLHCLKQVISIPKRHSSKWITTSISVKYHNVELPWTEYFVNNLFSPVRGCQSVFKSKCVLLQIGVAVNLEGDHLQVMDIFKGASENATEALLCGLGELHLAGYDLRVNNLYPKIQFPVSRGTPIISPSIKWNYDDDWFVAFYSTEIFRASNERVLEVQINDEDASLMLSHVIDERYLFPATCYLLYVWESYAVLNSMIISQMQIIFENVRFHSATNIRADASLHLSIYIQKSTGIFEIIKQDQIVVSGKIRQSENIEDEMVRLSLPLEDTHKFVLTTKDIYKELNLRGYNYTGQFCALKECDLSATKGKIEWNGTRNFYVPTGIDHLAIDAKAHIRYATSFGETGAVNLPVYAYKDSDIIKSGGIELRGFTANSIARHKRLGEPVLESHKFIPLNAKLTIAESVRVNMQIILENNCGIKIRAAEVIDDFSKENSTPIGPIIHQVFGDEPLIHTEIIVLSKISLDLNNVTVENRQLASENNSCVIIVVSDIFKRTKIFPQVLRALKEDGFIISREELTFDETSLTDLHGLNILTVHETDNEKFLLLRKKTTFSVSTVIEFSESVKNFKWLSAVQNTVKHNENTILYSQSNSLNGILGFVNCLRREPGGVNVKCVFVMDENVPTFDVQHEFYLKQLKKCLVINIYKNGTWGTYRHLLLRDVSLITREHVFNNVTVRGDLSSLSWIEGPLSTSSKLLPEKSLVHIYYSALNFRDIMIASGYISNDVIIKDRLEQYNVQGCEFSGRDTEGSRVAGMINCGALSTMAAAADSYLIFSVPEYMSLEEAVTIPVAYSTALHALIVIAHIHTGQSVLIHSGTGGVGQAAINIALHYKCEVFTTVGTQEKKEFLMKEFSIPESHIGNSHDTSFEEMIFKETKGRGVDIVLNSLSEEKLQASVRCLAPNGVFLEIGKFDLINNNRIGLQRFHNGRSFSGVMLDAYLHGTSAQKTTLLQLVLDGLKDGYVKPLKRKIFSFDEVETAFRYMSGGKHIGKVVIQIREEEKEQIFVPEKRVFNCLPRFCGNPNASYIISGGLGGVGLELADWLVLRGVKNLVLISRSGVKTGYQASRLRIWKSYGVATIVLTEDVTTYEGCVVTIEKAKELGPVEAIFNLAAVLKDALLENQNQESFIVTLAPKAISTQHLDIVTRAMCPELKYFVVFSSVSCGRGYIGQTNYGMSNSIMERVCENRKKDGYPALAIQWGAIGDVGIVAEMQQLQTDIEIGGTLPQRISSCLEVIDQLLIQVEPIVSSMVVAEKKGDAGGENKINIADVIKNILGLRDLKTVSHHSTLSELGMDSMMAVEIKQTLEREYDVVLTAQDIRNMTFSNLHEIATQKVEDLNNPNVKSEEYKKLPEGIFLLLRDMGDENDVGVPVIRLNSLTKEKAVAPKVFILPGIEGRAIVVEPLASNLTSHAICLQFTFGAHPYSTVEEIATAMLPRIQENLPKSTPFTLLAYSYGCLVALQLAAYLELDGRIGKVILIDGAPSMFKELLKKQIPETENDQVLQTMALCTLMQTCIPIEAVLKYKNDIFNCMTFEDRVNLALSYAPENLPYSDEYQRQACVALYLRLKSVLIYQPSFRKLKSMVKLFKPSKPILEDYDEDYKLQELCDNPIGVSTFDGNHLTILKNLQFGNAVNTIIATSSVYFNQSIIKD